jgi:hypothetical protein
MFRSAVKKTKQGRKRTPSDICSADSRTAGPLEPPSVSFVANFGRALATTNDSAVSSNIYAAGFDSPIKLGRCPSPSCVIVVSFLSKRAPGHVIQSIRFNGAPLGGDLCRASKFQVAPAMLTKKWSRHCFDFTPAARPRNSGYDCSNQSCHNPPNDKTQRASRYVTAVCSERSESPAQSSVHWHGRSQAMCTAALPTGLLADAKQKSRFSSRFITPSRP